MFASLDLSSGWSFRRFGDKAWLPAAVPGNVFLDLYQAGLIPDPYYRDHEKQVQWVGYEDWEYRTFFSLDKELEAPRIDLLFEGLDTLATVTLNDHVILNADNMFRTWRVDVRRFLQPQNELHILFRSPIRSLLPQIESLDVRCPAVNDTGEGTSPYVRKAPYQFGWDWAPRLVGCGVWKPIRLQIWDIARIESLQILTADLAPDRAEVSVLVEIEAITEAEIDVVLSSMDGAFLQKRRRLRLSIGKQTIRFDVEIKQPKLWEPNGRGEAHLYRLILFIEYRGQVLDERQARFGLRTVRLEEEPNTDGAGFTFVVNNKPLFAKGANWIPADCFPHRVSRDKYRELLLACRDAGMNMLRVWGGGIYESDDFYDLCDELGLLVWQDFMFSCALYPAEGEFLDSVKQEAVDQVKRLRNHPCLALWCGNNEIEWGWQAFGWSTRLPAVMFQQNQTLFRQILAEIVATNDPGRPYWPSSPSSNSRADANSPSFGDMHYWDVWHKAAPFASYLDQHPRFMSEFGFQSFPVLETVKTFAEPQDFDIESPVMLLHQKNPRGNQLIRDYLLRYYPPAKDFASFLYLSQVQQAEAIRTAAEHLRRIRPHCMGALYWQLNDCWPVASWSSIDYEGNWKTLHYAAVRFYKPLLVSPLLTEEEIRVYVVSDLEESIAATLLIELLTFDGQIIRRERRPVFIQPNSTGLFAVMPRSELGVVVLERSLLYCTLEGQDVENVLY
ncbi:MAG: hypothetical protein ONA69_09125, partial [candidate division KSB1 bacterium]|nr:hypothetical protein [candidate division KSB1 bacterium]